MSLWSRDRETVWAFNSIRYRRGFPPVGYSYTTHGRTVRVARPNLPYGASSFHHTNSVIHYTDRMLLGWRRGVFMGAQMRWLCGSRTETFILLSEPAGPMCVICLVRAGAVQSNITNIHIGQVTINDHRLPA